jgi:hypothetical protein
MLAMLRPIPAWYGAAETGGEKRAGEKLKALEQVMTQCQINKAKNAADQLSKSLPKIKDATNASSIANSFIAPQK